MCKINRYRLRGAPAEDGEGRNPLCSGVVQLVVEALRCWIRCQNWTKDKWEFRRGALRKRRHTGLPTASRTEKI